MPKTTVDTSEAIAALRDGLAVYAPDLTFRKTWLRKRTKTTVERYEVLTIEPCGQGYAVTFVGGRVRVVAAGATFWVGEP